MWYNEYVHLLPLLFWRGYWRLSANVYTNEYSLSRNVNSLCHSQIAVTNCSIWSYVDARWYSSTCRVFSQKSLKSTVGDRVISRHFPFPWLQDLLILTLMDFWLWVYGKSKVHQFHSQTVSDLKDAIRIVIQEIPISMVRAAMISTSAACKMLWCVKEVMLKICETK